MVGCAVSGQTPAAGTGRPYRDLDLVDLPRRAEPTALAMGDLEAVPRAPVDSASVAILCAKKLTSVFILGSGIPH